MNLGNLVKKGETRRKVHLGERLAWMGARREARAST